MTKKKKAKEEGSKFSINYAISKVVGEADIEVGEVNLRMDFSTPEHSDGSRVLLPQSLVVLMNQHKLNTINIKDKYRKWQYSVSVSDLVFYSEEVEHMKSKKYACPISQLKVLKASNRASVVRCEFKSCTYNYCNHCTKGTIKLTTTGRCSELE